MRKPRSPDSQRNKSVKQPREAKSSDAGNKRFDDEQWQRDMATLRCAAEEIASRRRIPQAIERRSDPDTFQRLATSLNDSSLANRGPAIRKLYNLDPERAATFLNITLQECTPDERQQIAAALEASGLVDEAIRNLTANNHSRSYRAFSLLFLVAKAGAIRPLLRIIESHSNMQLRLALIRLLGSSRPPDLVFQFQRLLANNALPMELSIAVKEALTNLDGKRSQPGSSN